MLKKISLLLLKKIWSPTRSIFWAGLWLFGLALLLWYPMRWWPGDRFRPVQLFNYFMPWLLAGLLPGLLLAVLAQRKRLAMVLAAPTLFIGATFAPLFLPRFNVALAAGLPLKVMSYNVLYRNSNLEAAMVIIRQEQPDILLLQEVTPTIAQNFTTLRNLYPDGALFFDYHPQFGQAIISRFPITPVEVAYEKGRTQKVLVNTPDGPIAVWNVHPIVPVAWEWHYQQISALAQDIAAANDPLIVGGDFNTTDQSETYRLINQHLENAHWQAGWGFGFTFPAQSIRFKGLPVSAPVIRIDHIFYSHHFFVHSAETLPRAGGSDHRPIMAQFSLIE